MSYRRYRFQADGHLVTLVLVAFTLLVRVGALAARFDHLAADPDGYRALAQNVIDYGVLGSGQKPSAYRPPLYPILLAACSAGPWKSETATGMLHLALGVATVLMTVALGRRWGLGGFAYLAGALVACDPILLNQSTLVMTETLAIFLAVAALWWTTATVEATGRRQIAFAAATGVSFAIAALCRPTFLVSLLFMAAGVGHALPRGRQRWRTLAAMCIAASIGLLPWAARNWTCLGKPVVTTTHGGYTLLLGNNPAYYDFLETSPWRAIWNAAQLDNELRAARSGDELANDRDEYASAWQTIRQRPTTFLYASLHRFAALWGVLPHQVTAEETAAARYGRYAIAAWYIAIFLSTIAAVGQAFQPDVGRDSYRQAGQPQLRKPPWLWAALLIASFTAVHLVYWTDMRMRAPLMPAISLLAAAGARRLASRWRASQEAVP